MHQRFLSYPWLLALPLVLLANLFAASQASADETGDKFVAEIVEQWKQRQQAVDTVKYVCKGKEIHMKGSISKQLPTNFQGTDNRKPLPVRDETVSLQCLLFLDLAGNRVRKQVNDYLFFFDQGNKFLPREVVDMYDGKSLYRYEPKSKFAGGKLQLSAKSPDWVLRDDSWKSSTLNMHDYPLLFAHGIIPRTDSSFPSVDDLRPRIPLDHFRYQGMFNKNGEQCHVLRDTKNQNNFAHEFWVSTQKNGAIVYWTYSEDGVINQALEIDWIATPEIQYAPKRWKFLQYDRGEKPSLLTTRQMEVVQTEFGKELNPQLFSINAKPGEVILDNQSEQRQQYYINQDGKKVLVPSSDSSNSWLAEPMVWLVIGCLIAITCIGGIYFYRSRNVSVE